MVRDRSEKEAGAKRAYENPKMEIVSFQAADVIVTSIGATNDDDSSTTKWTGYY